MQHFLYIWLQVVAELLGAFVVLVPLLRLCVVDARSELHTGAEQRVEFRMIRGGQVDARSELHTGAEQRVEFRMIRGGQVSDCIRLAILTEC